ncbi:MAG: hypothetical protein GXO47_08750 [Chlorobi bacterium]|nr:hypothetical protein [Chlorobiota bacterium]
MFRYTFVMWIVIAGFVGSGTKNLYEKSTGSENCIECHTDVTGFKNMHPVMEDGCTTCHEPQGESHPESGTFKLADKVPDLCFVCHEEYHKKNIHAPASEGDCLSCHSPHGSDNEALLTTPKEELCVVCHDMGNTESYKPHFSGFNAVCSDCHDAHQSDNAALLKQPVPDICFECHEDFSNGGERESIHYPYTEESCMTCHKPHGSGLAGMLTEKMPELCYECHDVFNKKDIHSPVSDGECTVCHSPHASDNSGLLIENKEELCLVCHDLETGEGFKSHFDNFNSACSDCHDPHQSENLSLLHYPVPEMCFQCHEDESNEGEAVSVHYPYSEESCTVCHKPHGSVISSMLNEKTPELCFMCHEQGEYAFVHQPYRNGECSRCHSPHASQQQVLLKMNNKDVCLQCHNKTYKTDSTHTENIARKIKNSKYIHGALEMDGCVTCHTGHGADFPELLNGSYPSGYYAPGVEESYALCFNCHDPAILKENPSVSGTGFRNGNTNLHYVHLKGDKGRSCSMCHDVHAEKNSHLIREKVPFGDWTMDMNYKETYNGGYCMPGCHGELVYDRSLVQ